MSVEYKEKLLDGQWNNGNSYLEGWWLFKQKLASHPLGMLCITHRIDIEVTRLLVCCRRDSSAHQNFRFVHLQWFVQTLGLWP